MTHISRPRPKYAQGKDWRALYKHTFADPSFQKLSCDGRHAWWAIYGSTNQWGLEPLSAAELEARVMKCCDMGRTRARRAVSELRASFFIVHDTDAGLLWVVDALHLFKQMSPRSPATRLGLAKVLYALPESREILTGFYARYPEWLPAEELPGGVVPPSSPGEISPQTETETETETKDNLSISHSPAVTRLPCNTPSAADAAGVSDDGTMDYITREAA